MATLGTLLVSMLCTMGLQSQEREATAGFFECIQSTYPGNKALDSLMAAYEEDLVVLNLLNGSEARDYRGLLQRIASGQRIGYQGAPAFSERLRDLPRDSIAWHACLAGLEQYKALNPESKLTRFMDRRNAMILEGIPADLQAAALLDILGLAEFGQAFYRLQTYYVIDLQSRTVETLTPSEIGRNREATLLSGRGANVFRIYLNQEDQCIVDDRLVLPSELSRMLGRHANTFGPEALYIIDLEADVKYSQFIALKDQIALAVSSIRNDYARRAFGKTLIELSADEKLLVENRYPIRVLSP